MKGAILVLSTILAVAFAKHHPLSDEFIAEINKKATTWKAGKNFEIHEWDYVKKISSGAYPLTEEQKSKLKVKEFDFDLNKVDVPESFDAAEKWPQCESIREIRDQSKCGSCWALAGVEAMSDRICIHSNGTLQTRVSAQDLMTCCNSCGSGCQGGYIFGPWSYWESDGISTGGLYNRTDQGCKSYFLPECEDHPHNCRNYVNTPECVKKCDKQDESYTSSLTFGVPDSLRFFTSVKQIQVEIMTNGPVEAGYTIFDDFVSYQSGIYQRTSENALGGHAVKIVGWGVENGVKYWKIANSWNERWGENGYFRIIRGVDSCGIEDQVVSGLPKLS